MRNLKERKGNYENQNYPKHNISRGKKGIRQSVHRFRFFKIVNSLSSKPETKTTSTQFFEADFVIHTNTRVITPSVKSPVAKTPSASPSNVLSIARSRANSTTRPHSQSSSKPSSQSSNQSSTQSRSQSNSQSNPKKE